ncbi:hypothetical protein ACQ4PT_013844 [Festuca glaucescens]
MGCWYPLREIVSKALGKCNGHERWREDDQRMNYAMAYPPGPPTETHFVRPGARTVTFSGTNSVHMIPPSPQGPQQQAPEPQRHQAPPPQHEPEHQNQPQQPQPAPEQGAPPQAEQPRKRGKKKPPRRVRFGPDQQPPPQQQQQQQQETQQQHQQPEHAPSNGGGGNAPGHQGHGPHGPAAGPQHHPAHGPPGYFRYTPSPLPRWEATPRRHEYFSGEYRYSYPTPVREGIYSLATDANRLTTIFSEENPNACAIV